MKFGTLAILGGSVLAAMAVVWLTKNIVWISIIAVVIAALIFFKRRKKE
jgi:LPXTG-motif cell wall-anchored protein